jgi:hypothetical protein
LIGENAGMEKVVSLLPTTGPERVAIFVWFALIPMVLAWFGLVWWLFRRLRLYHPATYETLGSPTLFWNNSPRLNMLFGRFLFGLQWRQLPDPLLARVCWVMVVLGFSYMTLFIGLVAFFFWNMPHH